MTLLPLEFKGARAAEGRERGGREALPTDVLIQQRRIISVTCNEYPPVHVCMCA